MGGQSYEGQNTYPVKSDLILQNLASELQLQQPWEKAPPLGSNSSVSSPRIQGSSLTVWSLALAKELENVSSGSLVP